MAGRFSNKTVLVVVDAVNPGTGKRYRSSFWENELKLRELSVEEYCVPDYVKKHEIVPINNADIFIVSWDTVNGDPVCEADVTLRFFQSHGKNLVASLMSNGSILFSDFQTAYGVPVQASYDALFGKGELTVLDRVLDKDALSGKEAIRFNRSARHPLLPAEPKIEAQPISKNDKLFSLSVNSDRKDILPFEHYRDSLWFGWFTSWRRDWIPLLSASQPHDIDTSSQLRRVPVLLAKVVDNGLLVASTMSPATAKCTKLIDKLVEADLNTIRQYHSRAMLRRNLGDLVWAGIIFLALVLISLGLWSLYASETSETVTISSKTFTVFSGTVAVYLKLLLSVLSVGVLTAISLARDVYWKYVWNRPHGTGVLEPLWVRLQRYRSIRRH